MVPSLTVTIAITNYNHGRYLRGAVESALVQTHRAIRVVVIDDGSTDDSHAILDALPDTVEVLRQENRGVVEARNRLLETVGTSHVVFLDADNYLLPGFLRWHVAAWQVPHGRRLALTYSPARNIGADGEIGHLHSGPWSPGRLGTQNYIDNTALFLRAALQDVGGYSTAYAGIGHEDWDLMLKLVDHNWNGRMVPRPLFVYRTLARSRNEESLADGGRSVSDAIQRDHPWTAVPPVVGRLERLHVKATNPLQTFYRRWDSRGL